MEMDSETTTNASRVVGPAPFTAMPLAVAVLPPDESGDADAAASPTTFRPAPVKRLRLYQGTWVPQRWVPGLIAVQRDFTPRPGDVVLASPPKCGTTWLKALAFATMARGAHPVGGHAGAAEHHPLLRLNPHECVPFMEFLFAAGQGSKMDALPSPRLMATHMQHALLPASIRSNPDRKIIYICREPKDMLVSLWHFANRAGADAPFSEVLEAACEGKCVGGPIWDHVLGYWNAGKESPEAVLFLRYEDMLRDPAGSTRNLARFIGRPFSAAEEEAGVVTEIVKLCSFQTLKGLEVNKVGSCRSPFPNDSYFRKGEVGDWANHMTPDMALRLDAIVEEKLRGSGLSFM